MYAIVINNEQDLLEIARERGLTILKISAETPINFESLETSKRDFENVYEFLIFMGIRPQLKGFKYLKYIFENNIDYSDGITTMLYPYIAEHFNTTPTRVERAIRHAIESATRDTDLNVKKMYMKLFGSFNEAPTNNQFLDGCKWYLESHSIIK